MSAGLEMAALLGWGAIVGVDLVSGPQGLLARPLVAGSVAGALAGDVETGLRVGALLELFALDVLPVGAARYPDYGPATVAAAALAIGLGGGLGAAGLGVLVGLGLAMLGGWSLERLRNANGRLVQRHAERLAAGDLGLPGRLQRLGFLRDGIRSLALTAIGLALALIVVALRPPTPDVLGWVALAGGAYAATAGALRRASGLRGWGWFTAGLVAAAVAVVVLG